MRNRTGSALFGTIAWAAALGMAFPIIWMLITAFKTEAQAIAIPPLLVFRPVLTSFQTATSGTAYLSFAINTLVVSLGSTVLATLIAFPAAYAMAFRPGRHTQDLLVWMLSTKMLPPVGALIPVYIIFRDVGLLDTRTGLVIVD